jgi:hypothetical protein
MKHTESSGVLAFNSIADDEVQLADFESKIQECVVLHEVEIGNSSGEDAACGWALEDQTAKCYLVTDPSDDGDYGIAEMDKGGYIATLNAAEDTWGLLIEADKPFHIVNLEIETSGAALYQLAYSAGDEFISFNTVITDLDFNTESTVTTLSFLPPADWAPLTSNPGDDDVGVIEDITLGKYYLFIMVYDDMTEVVFSKVARLMDYVETVATGTSSVKSYAGGKKLLGQQALIPFCSKASEDNWVSIEYSKAP